MDWNYIILAPIKRNIIGTQCVVLEKKHKYDKLEIALW